MRARHLLASAATLLVLGCANAGETRLTTIDATGIVRGFVYFDLNGNRIADAADDSVQNITVRVLTLGTRDVVASAVSDVRGFFRMSNVPVGRYLITADTTPLLDTALVVQQDSAAATVLPFDSVHVNIGISWPHVTVAQARAMAPGRRVFITGIALNSLNNYRDTTVHVQDVTAGIRMTRVLSTPVVASDSVRARGTTARRQESPTVSQPTLDNVTVFIITPRFLPTADSLSTQAAASAAGGARDAQQVRVVATVSDTTRFPNANSPDVLMTVNDGSGALEVLVDQAAYGTFNPPGQCGGPCWIPGNRFSIVGIMVPTPTAGIWRLKPRNPAELVRM